MKQLTPASFRTWIRRLIDIAIDDDCAPGDLLVILRNEATRLAEDRQGGTQTTEYIYVLPNDDPAVKTGDVLAQVIAGSVAGRTIRFHGLELQQPGHELWASMWAVHDAETGTFREWINARSFRTASELEEYLREVDADSGIR